jgi:hypothetical protein
VSKGPGRKIRCGFACPPADFLRRSTKGAADQEHFRMPGWISLAQASHVRLQKFRLISSRSHDRLSEFLVATPNRSVLQLLTMIPFFTWANDLAYRPDITHDSRRAAGKSFEYHVRAAFTFACKAEDIRCIGVGAPQDQAQS